ncbi:hypothetical protein [Variovorax sp. PvP013_2]
MKSTDWHQQDAGASAPVERAASIAQAFDAPHKGHSVALPEVEIVDGSTRR